MLKKQFACLFLFAAIHLHSSAQTDQNNEITPLPPPSSSAQKLYSAAKNDLLQIRVLVKNGRTQSSVGSGFLVGQSDLVVTNYHVVSQIALEPDIYAGEYVDTHDQRGNVELLAVDVLHDLAVVRIARKGTGFFQVPDKAEQLAPLDQGQYLYSLGNPLDLGFAISEGAYNGVIARSFYDQFMFTGPINSGMSGGPNVTANGALAGVNVAKRTDGELVSFLVPGRFVVELLNRVKSQKSPPAKFSDEVTRQLIVHQHFMVDQLLAKPLNFKSLGPYQVPVRESEQMRCWGSSNGKDHARFSEDRVSCAMESAIYISHKLQTGHINLSHTYTRGNNLGSLRFARLMSHTFKNQINSSNRQSTLTGAACVEDFIKNESSSMRAVICTRAYRKLIGLYDFMLVTASLDQENEVLQTNLTVRGVSYENGMRILRQVLKNISRNSTPETGARK